MWYDIIGWMIIYFIFGFGTFAFISWIFCFLMLGLDENSFIWKLCEWSIDNRWCFPLYYMFLIALGFIGFMFQDLLNDDIKELKK